MSHEVLRIVVVDDDPMWLSLTAALADKDEGVEMVGRASSGDQTLTLVKDVRPQVVLLDLAMPDVDGLTLLPEVLEQAPGCKVVVVTGNDFAPLREMAIEGGATGVLAKNPLESLFDRLRDVLGLVAN